MTAKVTTTQAAVITSPTNTATSTPDESSVSGRGVVVREGMKGTCVVLRRQQEQKLPHWVAATCSMTQFVAPGTHSQPSTTPRVLVSVTSVAVDVVSVLVKVVDLVSVLVAGQTGAAPKQRSVSLGFAVPRQCQSVTPDVHSRGFEHVR
mmetsp:Transcript_38166/g.82237  ORF Transcript_38166/g.82237 Transcript_38166/m.82237 type:complete len:149 (+) Transcript_38166:1206-1652(+)